MATVRTNMKRRVNRAPIPAPTRTRGFSGLIRAKEERPMRTTAALFHRA
jgi:hypothetical protein